MSEEVLIDLGLTSNESKIYLSLLEIGCTTVTNISERTKLHRTNVYDALKKLVDKGLVSIIKQDNIGFYESCDPNTLLGLIKEKEIKLKKALPRLLLIKKLAENTADYSVIKGVSPFLEKIHEFFDSKNEILVLGMPKRAIKLLGARIMPFHTERINKRVFLRQIYFKELKDLIRKKQTKHTATRFCEDNDDYGVSSMISGDLVLITDWAEDVYTLCIKNKAVANHYKAQFEAVWKNSKK